jgi:peptide/nickel transport system substrate-binding protein
MLLPAALAISAMALPAAAQDCVTVAGTDWVLEGQSVDPIINNTVGDLLRITALYEKLAELDNGYEPIPVLAESWQSNEDGTVWTITLRAGVTFHDGSPLDADDVIHSLKRAADPATGSQGASVLTPLHEAAFEAADARTVRITLAAPQVELPLLLSTKFAAIVPAGADTASLQMNPVGTGPFMVEGGFVAGQAENRLVAFAGYRDAGEPQAPCLTVTGIGDSVARIAALVSGEVDVLVPVDPTAVPTLRAAEGVQVLSSPGGSVMTLSMWADTAPFDDPRVREAMKLVIDRQAMVDVALMGAGSPGNDNPVPPSSPDAYRSDIIAQDVERAKALLAEAGHPDGIDIDLYTSDALPGMAALAEMYVQMAAPAGINVNLIRSPAETYFDDVWLKRSFLTSSWGGRPTGEALSIAYLCSTTTPETRWCNSEFDTLVTTAQATVDPAERRKLYQAAQRILAEDGGVIVPGFLATIIGLREGCTGYVPNNNVNNHDWSSIACE